MDKIFEDMLNASIALFRNGEKELTNKISEFEKTIEVLTKEGQAYEGNRTQQVRDIINKTIKDTRIIIEQIEMNNQSIFKTVNQNFSQMIEVLERNLPSEMKEKIHSSIEDLNKMMNLKK